MWQRVDAFEECPALQNTATRDELSQALRVDRSKVGTDRRDGLGSRAKIENLLRFVVKNPMHTVAVVEERHSSVGSVRQKSVE
jgi:hypothetical protein